jgi:hypothetical protein
MDELRSKSCGCIERYDTSNDYNYSWVSYINCKNHGGDEISHLKCLSQFEQITSAELDKVLINIKGQENQIIKYEKEIVNIEQSLSMINTEIDELKLEIRIYNKKKADHFAKNKVMFIEKSNKDHPYILIKLYKKRTDIENKLSSTKKSLEYIKECVISNQKIHDDILNKIQKYYEMYST